LCHCGKTTVHSLLRCFERQNLTENQGDTLLLVGRRQMTSSGQVLYHVGVSTRNASASISGHYQCIVERQNDRMFAVATVAAAGRKSPLSHIPLIEIRSCRKESFNRFETIWLFSLSLSLSLLSLCLSLVLSCSRCVSILSDSFIVNVFRKKYRFS